MNVQFECDDVFLIKPGSFNAGIKQLQGFRSITIGEKLKVSFIKKVPRQSRIRLRRMRSIILQSVEVKAMGRQLLRALFGFPIFQMGKIRADLQLSGTFSDFHFHSMPAFVEKTKQLMFYLICKVLVGMLSSPGVVSLFVRSQDSARRS